MQLEFVTKQDLNSLRKLILEDIKKILKLKINQRNDGSNPKLQEIYFNAQLEL